MTLIKVKKLLLLLSDVTDEELRGYVDITQENYFQAFNEQTKEWSLKELHDIVAEED